MIMLLINSSSNTLVLIIPQKSFLTYPARTEIFAALAAEPNEP